MGTKDTYDITDELSYLTIPVNANWHFGRKRNWYLNFGPFVSYLLSAKADGADVNGLDIKDYVSFTDIGLCLGIGYIFAINDATQIFIDYQGYGAFIDLDSANNLPKNITNSKSSFNVRARFSV